MNKWLRGLHIVGLLFACVAFALTACADDDFQDALVEQTPSVTDRLQINFVVNGLDGTGSRAADVDKLPKEIEIKTLHLFFFDENGEFIQGTAASNFKGYELVANSTYIMPPNAFDHKDPVMAKIYAVANIEVGSLTDAQGNLLIKNEADLLNFKYCPKKEIFRDITTIPDDGMPMFGACYTDSTNESLRLVNINIPQTVKVSMKSLMARLDVTFSLDYSQTPNPENPNWPNFRIREYGIYNRALAVGFQEVAEGVTSSVLSQQNTNPANPQDKYTYLDEFTEPLLSMKTIYDKNSISTTVYVFENMQQPNALFPKTDAKWEKKVPGITSIDNPLKAKQRYKAKWADEKALSCYLRGTFTTANGGMYHVAYKIHVGKDQVGNYEVKRNNHYELNIKVSELKGIDNMPTEGSVKYDSRITLIEEYNDYFIEILREREHDAHICVTPMDIMIFDAANADVDPQMTLEVVSGSNWLKMEHIPGQYMESGTLPSNMYNNVSKGKRYAPCHGVRKYITKDLFSGSSLVSKCSLSNAGANGTKRNIDRVYLYVNENISTKDREGTIRVMFSKNVKSKNGTVSRETTSRDIKIKQCGLLEVYMPRNFLGNNDAQYFYIEQVEEYDDYYDPYAGYDYDHVYNGLKWGLMGVALKNVGNISGAYGQGLKNTQTILSEAKKVGDDIADMKYSDAPISAVEYCYNKNTRNSNGGVNVSANTGWFLPDIGQLQCMINTYQNRYSYFRNEFYWSSNTSFSDKNSKQERVNYARATMYNTTLNNGNGAYVESGPEKKENDYPETNHDSGVIGHNKSLRIRAAYFYQGGQRLPN